MQSASIVQCGKSMGLLQGNGKENQDTHIVVGLGQMQH